MKQVQNYSIKEASELCGLPESTLRYYETIGLISPVSRDSSSKHRVYNEDNLNLLTAIACLSATGMSIEDMRTYLKNIYSGTCSAPEQIALLEAQEKRLEEEAHYLELRRRYVSTKIAYWQAIATENKDGAEQARQTAAQIAKELKLPKEKK